MTAKEEASSQAKRTGGGKQGIQRAGKSISNTRSAVSSGAKSVSKLEVIIPLFLTVAQSLSMYFEGWDWPELFEIPFSWMLFPFSFDLNFVFPTVGHIVTPVVQALVTIVVCAVFIKVGARDNAGFKETVVIASLMEDGMSAQEVDEAAAGSDDDRDADAVERDEDVYEEEVDGAAAKEAALEKRKKMLLAQFPEPTEYPKLFNDWKLRIVDVDGKEDVSTKEGKKKDEKESEENDRDLSWTSDIVLDSMITVMAREGPEETPQGTLMPLEFACTQKVADDEEDNTKDKYTVVHPQHASVKCDIVPSVLLRDDENYDNTSSLLGEHITVTRVKLVPPTEEEDYKNQTVAKMDFVYGVPQSAQEMLAAVVANEDDPSSPAQVDAPGQGEDTLTKSMPQEEGNTAEGGDKQEQSCRCTAEVRLSLRTNFCTKHGDRLIAMVDNIHTEVPLKEDGTEPYNCAYRENTAFRRIRAPNCDPDELYVCPIDSCGYAVCRICLGWEKMSFKEKMIQGARRSTTSSNVPASSRSSSSSPFCSQRHCTCPSLRHPS